MDITYSCRAVGHVTVREGKDCSATSHTLHYNHRPHMCRLWDTRTHRLESWSKNIKKTRSCLLAAFFGVALAFGGFLLPSAGFPFAFAFALLRAAITGHKGLVRRLRHESSHRLEPRSALRTGHSCSAASAGCSHVSAHVAYARDVELMSCASMRGDSEETLWLFAS